MASETPPEPSSKFPKPSPFVIRLGLIVVGVIAMGGAFALALLPAAKSVGTAAQTLEAAVGCNGTEDIRFPRFPERSTIYASNGAILANIFLDENRTSVALKDISKSARKAVLGIEDYRFYDHGAIDPKAILRAAIENIRAGHVTQGGSTITQQLIKNVTGQRQETFRRKLDEMCLAIAAEQQYTKGQLLTLYLNEVYFGHGLYGIDTAAQSYFGIPASKLKLWQSALLAGVIAAPGRFDPVDHPKSAIDRRNQVLDRLATIRCVPHVGCMNPDKIRKLETKPLGLIDTAGEPPAPKNPFFVQYITKQILTDADGEYDALGETYKERKHTLFQGGLKIYTTLDPRLEQEALGAVRSHLPKPTDPQAAVSTVQVKTGAIRVLVSGRNFAQTHQDLVTGLDTTGGRQTGSAFKAFTLAAAFEQGVPPGRVYNEKSPIFLPDCNNWHIANAEGAGPSGYIDLWEATQDSINVVFAQLARDVGPQNIADVAHKMGITAPLAVGPADCSVTLGTFNTSVLDMSDAYATIANNGVHCPAYAVEKIAGRNGGVIYRHKPKSACTQAISPDIAHQITAMLQRVVCCGTGTHAQIGRPQAGKTGTNTEYRDAWFVGYVPQLSTAVWVGYPQGELPMFNVEGLGPAFGGTVAAPIWHDYMAQAVQGLAPESFPAPPPQQKGTIPNVVGLLYGGAEKILAKANFTAIRQDVPSAEPKGTVLAQAPAAGATAILGAGVRLSVSNGKPAKVDVPDVIGMTEGDARSALEQAGFVVDVVDADTHKQKEDGIVLDQDPKGGKKAEQGTTVTITVGRYQPRHHPREAAAARVTFA